MLIESAYTTKTGITYPQSPEFIEPIENVQVLHCRHRMLLRSAWLGDGNLDVEASRFITNRSQPRPIRANIIGEPPCQRSAGDAKYFGGWRRGNTVHWTLAGKDRAPSQAVGKGVVGEVTFDRNSVRLHSFVVKEETRD